MQPNPKPLYLEKYQNCDIQRLELLAFVELVANGKRSDGTYNYCREALETKAKELLKKLWYMESAFIEGDSEVGVVGPMITRTDPEFVKISYPNILKTNERLKSPANTYT